jgi:diguanylate cyclase (GGDEF)-like protein
MKNFSTSLKRAILNIFVLIAVLIIISLGVFSYYQINKLSRAQNLVSYTQEAAASTKKTTVFVLAADVLVSLLMLMGGIWLNKQLGFWIQSENKLGKSEDELIRLAYYDALTGLPNRTLLIQRIEEAISNRTHESLVAVIKINLDNLKNINASFGYEAGDELLQAFSFRLCSLVKESHIVAYLNSNKFVILLTELYHHQDASITAKKILDSFSEPIIIKNHSIFVTASIGISLCPHNGLNAKTLLKNADIATSLAKELGMNNYQFCTAEIALKVEKRALLDFHLHHALKAEEFSLVYQPKICLDNSKLSGLEVLLRWNKADIGIIYPDHFISIAESNGLIIPISEWMMRTALMQGKKWQAAGLTHFNIAINISTRQFMISDIVASLEQLLIETGFNPYDLELEITETLLMKNSTENFDALRTLKNMGIKITIDDFGTGYSSLNYLREFVVDKIKIDKSFIKDITENNDNNNIIIKAIIMMAHSLGIEVIAEGVETKAQEALLKKYQCDEAQGFFYSEALPAEQIIHYLKS